jgi:hypothetical protein
MKITMIFYTAVFLGTGYLARTFHTQTTYFLTPLSITRIKGNRNDKQ